MFKLPLDFQDGIYHLAPSGQAGFVLAKGALTSKTSGEGDIRKALVEARLVDCIVNLPGKLFLNTQIPASLWFLSRNRGLAEPVEASPSTSSGRKFRNRRDEILFIDARNLGHLINRRTLEFDDDDIAQIADTYHNWRASTGSALVSSLPEPVEGNYHDIPGFCKAAPIDRVRELDYVLTPGRYVGLPDEEDDFDFAELQAELAAQLAEESRLNALIQENLARVVLED